MQEKIEKIISSPDLWKSDGGCAYVPKKELASAITKFIADEVLDEGKLQQLMLDWTRIWWKEMANSGYPTLNPRVRLKLAHHLKLELMKDVNK